MAYLALKSQRKHTFAYPHQTPMSQAPTSNIGPPVDRNFYAIPLQIDGMPLCKLGDDGEYLERFWIVDLPL